jgi:hypothetical protein
MFWRRLIGLNFPSAAQETIDEATEVINRQRLEIEHLKKRLEKAEQDLGRAWRAIGGVNAALGEWYRTEEARKEAR